MHTTTSTHRRLTLGGVAALILSATWLVHRVSQERSLVRATASSVPLPRAVPVSPSQPADRLAGGHAIADPLPISPATVAPPRGDDDALRAWARQDPAGATRWLATAPAGPQRDVVLEIVCLEVVQYDPVEAIAIADRFGYPGMDLRENLVAQWAERDVGAAKDYAETLPAGPERDRLFGRVAFAWSKTNPAAAAHLVADEISPGKLQEEATVSVLHQWTRREPDNAYQWILSFPEGALRDRAVREWELARQLPP